MAHLHSCIGVLSFLLYLHDYLEYSNGVEVSKIISLREDPTDQSIFFRFVAWYLFGASGCLSPILYSTVNTIVKDDSEERALIMVGPL